MPAFNTYRLSGYEGPGSLTDTEREAIESWIGKNSKAYESFEAGSRRNHNNRRYSSPGKPRWLMDLYDHPPVNGLRSLAQIAMWKSRLAEERGRLDEALEHCLVVARAGKHWQQSVMIIEQLIGWAISGLAHDEIRRIVRRRDLDAATLQNFAGQLTDVYGGAYPQFNFEGERLLALDTVQRSFTKGGPGGGHLLSGACLGAMAALDPNNLKNWKFRAVFTPISIVLGMIHVGRNRTVEKFHLVYDELAARAKLSPYQRRQRGIGDINEIVGPSSWLATVRYCVVHMLLPNERVIAIAFRGQAEHEAVLTILAIERYRLAAGEYPPDLEALVQDGYIDKVPDDPYSDGPLLYRRMDDDFVLYGVGENFTDDGGELVRDEEGRPKRWGAKDGGDMIFWPVYRRQVEK
ncbi:MAG: hypothetical protein JSU70_23785 [Phycisphaerales bacterium]|nr:MAG: hypothetical protein JSU70_23785 [Phycisphaerales bacterium]